MIPSSKLNIVFVTPYLPLPLNDGAKVRDYNILARLAQHANVHLISYLHCSDDISLVDDLKDICSSVQLIDHEYWRDRSKISNMVRFVISILCLQPFTIFEFKSKLLDRAINECIVKYNAQIVQAQKLQLLNCLDNLPSGVVRVLDNHNIETEAWQSRYLNTKNSIPTRFVAYIQGVLTKRIEFNLEKYTDLIFTVSEHDRQTLYRELNGVNTQPNLVCARQGVDTNFFNPHTVKPIDTDIFGKHIIFTGSMSYAPNIDAVTFFAREIFPLIKSRSNRPFTFWIVGNQPVDIVKELATKDRDIIVTGSVPDVRPYLAMADVAIAPIRFGGGTKTKILEALSMQLPTVISCHSSEGIDNCGLDTSSFLTSTDDSSLFADSVIKFSNIKSTVGQLAREFVDHQYAWDISAKVMLQAYEEVLKKQ